MANESTFTIHVLDDGSSGVAPSPGQPLPAYTPQTFPQQTVSVPQSVPSQQQPGTRQPKTSTPQALPATDIHLEALKQISSDKERMRIKAEVENISKGPAELTKKDLADKPASVSGILGEASSFAGKAGLQETASALGGLSKTAEVLEGVFATLGPEGIAIGVALAAAAGGALLAAKAFKDMSDFFIRRGRELAQFSGPLSAATAQADVRSMLADIKEAEKLGPDIARLITAESKIENDIREILLPIKEFIVNELADDMEDIAAIIKVIAPFVVGLIDGTIVLPVKIVTALVKEFIDEITFGLLTEARKIANNTKKEPDDTDALGIDVLWQLLYQRKVPPNMSRDDKRDQLGLDLNMPVFGRAGG